MTGENAILAAFAALPPVLAAVCFAYLRRQRRLGRLTRPTAYRLIAGNALILLFLLSCLLLAGEVYLRFWCDTTDSFQLTKTNRRWMESYYRMNNAGVRDDIRYEEVIAPGKRRVTFLGDSFVVGPGIKNVDERYVNLIRLWRPDWEVHMIARDGYDTGRHLNSLSVFLGLPGDGDRSAPTLMDPTGRIVLRMDEAGGRLLGRTRSGKVLFRDAPREAGGSGKLIEVPDPDRKLFKSYELDTVVYVYVLNDISEIMPEWSAVLDRIYRDSEPGWLGRNSYLVNTLHYRLYSAREVEIANFYRFTVDAYDEGSPVWQQQVSRFQLLRALTETGGGRLLVVTFPFLNQFEGGYEHRHGHQLLGEFWDSIGVPHLDLLDVFDGMDPDELTVNRRDAHPNERAHRIAAEAILEFVEREM